MEFFIEMRDIIEKVCREENSKERQNMLERFREFTSEKGNEKECAFIFRKALSYFEEGTEEEKIASLKVISKIFKLPCPSFGISDEKTEVKYDEVLFAVYSCLNFLKSEDGNLRLTSANTLNHLRTFLEEMDYGDLFFNLLCLRNYEKDKRKIKNIEFCLDKIWCPFLEMIIEASMPNEVKRMKINVKDIQDEKEKKLAKEVENLANKMVEETENYAKRIMRLRGKYLLNENFIFYVDNLALFQVSYEIQKLMEMIKNKQLSDDLVDRYTKFRLSFCLKKNLEWLEKIENKKEFIYVDVNLQENKIHLATIENNYKRLKNIYDKISNLADWSINEDYSDDEFPEQKETEKNSYIG